MQVPSATVTCARGARSRHASPADGRPSQFIGAPRRAGAHETCPSPVRHSTSHHCRPRSSFTSTRLLDYNMAAAATKVRRGAFIVFEGLDRSGKSTQVQRLVDSLNKDGVKAVACSFPGEHTPLLFAERHASLGGLDEAGASEMSAKSEPQLTDAPECAQTGRRRSEP